MNTLLTHVAEILVWCFNPAQMLVTCRQQALNRTQRSAEVQRQVLGFAGIELQQWLADTWHFPELLMRLSDPAHAESPRVRNVLLAVKLARHSANG